MTPQGQTPQGRTLQYPTGGTAYSSSAPLAAGGTATTGWIDTSGYGSLLYALRSDKASAVGGIVVEYSKDKTNVIMGGAAGTYDSLGTLTQGVLVPKAQYTRISYTNGSTAQTSFYFEVKLSTTLIQPTETSINKPITPTNLAMVTKGPIEADDGTGSFDGVYRTGNSLNVNVTNNTSKTPTGATVTSVTQANAGLVQLLAANNARRGATFFSVSGTWLIKEGSGASATSFTTRIVTNGQAMLDGIDVYTGVVTAFGSGTINVTEES